MRMAIALIVGIVIVFLLMRAGVIVLDRNVFEFQSKPIINRGEIRNIREYKVIHNYIEMRFEKDPIGFESRQETKKLNKLMNDYHANNS